MHIRSPVPSSKLTTSIISFLQALETDPSLKNLKALNEQQQKCQGLWLEKFVSSNGFLALLSVIEALDRMAPTLFELVIQIEGLNCIRRVLNHGVCTY